MRMIRTEVSVSQLDDILSYVEQNDTTLMPKIVTFGMMKAPVVLEMTESQYIKLVDLGVL